MFLPPRQGLAQGMPLLPQSSSSTSMSQRQPSFCPATHASSYPCIILPAHLLYHGEHQPLSCTAQVSSEVELARHCAIPRCLHIPTHVAPTLHPLI